MSKNISAQEWHLMKRAIFRFAMAALIVSWSAGTQIGHARAPQNKTEADLQLYAVDANGNRLDNLVAGKYVAMIVEAKTSVFPDKVAAGLSARAEFTTQILGQSVKYSISLPVVNAGASSRLDPTVGTPTSGLKIGNDWQNRSWRERLDFYIPREVPVGTVTVTIRAKASSAKSVSRAFTFKIVR